MLKPTYILFSFYIYFFAADLTAAQNVTIWYPRPVNKIPKSYDIDAHMALYRALNKLPAAQQQLTSLDPIISPGVGFTKLTKRLIIGDDIDLRDIIKFYLFTSMSKEVPQRLYVGDVTTLKKSYFSNARPTKVVIHGYINDVNSEAIQDIKNAFLAVYDYNVIGVDWGLIANTVFYTLAAEKTQMVGEYVGTFLQFLRDNGVPASSIHIIGHSLGAHVAGFAGANLTGTVSRITGLDPAKPWFTGNPPDKRLDKSDAAFVDCIHTCGGYLGLLENICHSDFYPNGGVDTQPGCLLITLGVCSHGRSHEYFAESVLPNHKFVTYKCGSIPTTEPIPCTISDNLMGYPATPQSTGIFYSTTKDAYPYAFNITKS